MSSADTFAALGNRYRLDDRIASGRFGEVWRGTDVLLARPVAVKLLHPGYAGDSRGLARFRAEAQHAGALAHENIARIYDYDESDPAHPPFLVMELVDGPSLADVLANGPMEPGRVLDLVAQSAAGLDAAHRADLIHRDIRPENLLLAGGRVVKITNFGISRATETAPVTATGLRTGASAYLAPERLAGATGTPASDLYSLGVVAFQCLAGSVPFSGTDLEVALAHRHSPLPPLPVGVPAAAATLISELTAKDPGRRPSAGQVAARAGDLRDELFPGEFGDEMVTGAASAGQPVPGGAPDTRPTGQDPGKVPSRRRQPRAGRPALLWAVAGAAAVLATVLIMVIGLGLLRAPAPSSSRSLGADVARTVDVNGAALRGKPVAAVRRQLRHLGLVVRLRWQASGALPPGRVLSVAPAGHVPAGSVVVVTGTLQPAGSSLPGHSGRLPPGHGKDHRKARSPGRGQSQPSVTPTAAASPTATASPTPTSSPTASTSPSPTATASASAATP